MVELMESARSNFKPKNMDHQHKLLCNYHRQHMPPRHHVIRGHIGSSTETCFLTKTQ